MLYQKDRSKVDTLFIFDVSNQAFRHAFANSELKTKSGRFSGHIFGTATTIFKAMENVNYYSNYQFLFALDNRSKRKYEAYADYKAHRTSKESLGFNPLPEVINLCTKFPGYMLLHKDEEADDVIASVTGNLEKFGYKKDTQVFIFSSDRDLWQLNNRNVKFSGNKSVIASKEDFEKHFGDLAYDHPEVIALIKSIFGDSSDNIKGIPRLISKNIYPIFHLMDNNYTPECFYENYKNVKLTEKSIKKIEENKDVVFRNWNLVNLRRDLDVKFVENNYDPYLLRNFLVQFECYSLLHLISNIQVMD